MRLLTLALFLWFLPVRGQELLPFVENFGKPDLGDNQVWNVVQGPDNAMYFANNHYFLRYDGVVWERYGLPNRTVIRSIFVDGDKIYCGSYKEFGYWRRVGGKMVYKSLSAGLSLFEGTSANEEIWKVFRHQDKIYFQSFNELFIYDGKKMEKLRCPSQISYCYQIRDQLYVASVRNGISILDGKKFTPVKGWEILRDNVIHHMDIIDGRIHIFTKNNGVFVDTGSGLSPWNHPLNQIVREQTIVTAKVVSGKTLAIGTGLKGLYLLDIRANTWKHLDRQNGLKNNAILSIGTDRENDLWLGLDNGICHIEINSPVSVFADTSGILGSVYSLSTIPSGYLFVTNHGIFTSKDGILQVIPNSQGQVWDIHKKGNRFIIGHNDGTFIYEGATLEEVNHVAGGWKLLDSSYDDVYFQANYSGVVVYRDKNNLKDWKVLEGLTKPIRNIGQDRAGELWAADNYRSLYRIRYDNSFRTTKIENISQQNGIANDFGVRLFTYRNEVLFLIDNFWYVFDHSTEKLVKHGAFNRYFRGITDITPLDNDSFMVVRSGMLYLILRQDDEFVWQLLPQKYYEGKLIMENTRVIQSGAHLLVNLDDGFLSFEKARASILKSKVKVEAFYNNELMHSEMRIPYKSKVNVHLVPEYFGYNRPDLYYRLNESTQMQRVITGKIQLNNLGSGDQDIDVFVYDGRKFVQIASYVFNVRSPWYFSIWMILIYVASVALISYLYYKWNNIRYTQKLALQEEEMRHQADINEIRLKAENDIKIQEYEKHILELEVQNKSSEVAGKSFSIAKQGEIFDTINKILEDETDANRLKTEIKKAIRANALNKHEWEAFENNMKQLHQDFVETLTQRYPQLSSKDIKLCIYLRMNLSSKEIAPLMNISFRGVELHRYRLRKKMELDNEINLNKFMMGLK